MKNLKPLTNNKTSWFFSILSIRIFICINLNV